MLMRSNTHFNLALELPGNTELDFLHRLTEFTEKLAEEMKAENIRIGASIYINSEHNPQDMF